MQPHEPFMIKPGFRRHLRKQRSTGMSFSLAPGIEQKFIISLLLRLMGTRSSRWEAAELFNFSLAVLGERETYALLRSALPGKIDASNQEDLESWASKILRDRAMEQQVLSDLLVPALEEKLRTIKDLRNGGAELQKRLDSVARMFQLDPEELDLLFLFHLIRSNSMAREFLDRPPLDVTDYRALRHNGHLVLGQARRVFVNILDRSPLFSANLITLDDDTLELQGWLRDYLMGVGDRELKNTFFTTHREGDLEVGDFGLLPSDLRVLELLLRSRKGCNILFYGAPGTGKTSLAHALAKRHRKELYAVRVSEGDNEHGFRLQAIYATVNAATGARSLIVTDEADEILNTERQALFRSRNETDKSWLNHLLDSHDRKMIWITNATEHISASTMRRFSFSLRFDRLTAKNRAAIFRRALGRSGLRKALQDSEVQELAARYDVDAGGIVNAVQVMKLQPRAARERCRETIETVLRNHQEATTGKRQTVRPRDFRSYSLAGLHTSHDLEGIIAALRDFSEKRTASSVQSVSLLLHGMPGTGKSEFVHYLGRALGRDITLKRVSDIEDKYVGETEKNIAEAFREAQANGNLLFFDEADSFFYPRKDAVRSFEKKFTNELLAQLDNFQGIVLFATNDIEGLDRAAIRRFRFKVQFRPLTAEGIAHFYRLLLAGMVRSGAELTDREQDRLSAVRDLTPGDLAVVKDQYSIMPRRNVAHQELIEALEREAAHKRERKLITGFGAEKVF